MNASRNARLYPYYVVCINGFFWFPVFFLYLTNQVGLEQTLQLEAIYYVTVVAFEVPSGWLSDRLGRRLALRSAMALLSAAYLAFFFGDTFASLAVAQVLLGAGFAFNSGTDTAFHYDSLAAVGREAEYAAREEKFASLSFFTAAATAVAGGALGAIELRYAYGAAFVMTAIGFVLTLAFVRPEAAQREEAERFDKQIIACVADLKQPVLAWFFAFTVLMTVLIHVPYHLYQPYLDLVGADLADSLDIPTPLATGMHACAAMLIASVFASHSVRLAARIGVRTLILGAVSLSAVTLLIVGAFLHPLVAVLLLFRSLPRALTQATVNAMVTPRVPQQRRASFLSLNSLAGRLGFSLFLLTLSWFVGTEAPAWADVSVIAWSGAGIALFGLVILGVTARSVGDDGALAAALSED